MSIEAETDVDKYRTHRRLPLSSQQLSRKRDSLRLIPNAEASDRTRYGIGGIYSGTAFLFRRARDIDTIVRSRDKTSNIASISGNGKGSARVGADRVRCGWKCGKQRAKQHKYRQQTYPAANIRDHTGPRSRKSSKDQTCTAYPKPPSPYTTFHY